MNFKIAEFPQKPLWNINDASQLVTLDWVTHGDYSVHIDNNNYMALEAHFPDEILKAYETASKPSYRTPFWSGVVKAKGWCLGDDYIEAYATDKGYIKLINSSCTFIGNHVPTYHGSIMLKVDVLEKMRDAITNHKK